MKANIQHKEGMTEKPEDNISEKVKNSAYFPIIEQLLKT
jgi:hypothetical protein